MEKLILYKQVYHKKRQDSEIPQNTTECKSEVIEEIAIEESAAHVNTLYIYEGIMNNENQKNVRTNKSHKR